MRYVDHSDQAIRRLLEGKKPLVLELATTVRDEIVGLMERSTPSGRTYKSRGYTASAPGQPPAKMSGDYIHSWKVTEPTVERRRVVARVYTDLMSDDGKVLRGIYLEYGTGNLRPRPHIRPGVKAAIPRVKQRSRRAERGGH